jgi:hypothetical protein
VPSQVTRSLSPWRSLGLAVGVLGGPATVSYLHPVLGLILTIGGVTIIAMVVATALFGTLTRSDRAFRLIRILTNRPELPTSRELAIAPLTDSIPRNEMTDVKGF